MSNMCYRFFLFCALCLATINGAAPKSWAQSSTSSPVRARAGKAVENSVLDPGSVSKGVYRNNALRLTCKIPEGWVLRTDEMNSDGADQGSGPPNDHAVPADPSGPNAHASSTGARVLLAAFSRPPQAKGEDVNASIVIAAEPLSAYPGLTEADQYLAPLTEVAQANGFTQDGDAYDVAMGPQKLARADFAKEVGSRVMRQSTLAMLSEGYAVSMTFIAGTDDQLQDLVDGLDFSGSASTRHTPK
jgi:hypothetical protein